MIYCVRDADIELAGKNTERFGPVLVAQIEIDAQGGAWPDGDDSN